MVTQNKLLLQGHPVRKHFWILFREAKKFSFRKSKCMFAIEKSVPSQIENAVGLYDPPKTNRLNSNILF